MKFAIVAVGYNRPYAISRLLNSVSEAAYLDDMVDLVISIDKGERQSEIKELADAFKWDYGDKRVVVHETRLGLRPHILKCGDLTKQYDAVIILEDDITVAQGFYTYAKQSVQFYQDDNRIAGISLYLPAIHYLLARPFIPVSNGFDTYLMQIAQSWGQCWTRDMWLEFRRWYDENSEKSLVDDNFPDYISSWGERSWLKFYMKYILDTNKFFVYPYISLSTNHSDVGEHCLNNNNDYQVPLMQNTKKYCFPIFDEAVFYDIFFERINLKISDFNGKNICIDLYGLKKNFKNYDILFSTMSHPYRLLKEVALKYRPHEVNCSLTPEGRGIFVYDLNIPAKSPKYDMLNLVKHDIRLFNWKKSLKIGFLGFLKAIIKKFGKE